MVGFCLFELGVFGLGIELHLGFEFVVPGGEKGCVYIRSQLFYLHSIIKDIVSGMRKLILMLEPN